MPRHPLQAAQARCNSSIALVGEGAPSRGLSDRKAATARRTLTLHRAVSICVCRPVARMDARAKRTAGASARSAGNFRTVAGSDMGLNRPGASAISGRGDVNEFPALGSDLAGMMSKTLTSGMAIRIHEANSHATTCNLDRQPLALSAMRLKKAWSTSFTSEWAPDARFSCSASSITSTWPLMFMAARAWRAFGSARMIESASAVATPKATSLSDVSLMVGVIGASVANSHRLHVAVNDYRQPSVERGHFAARLSPGMGA